MKHIIGIKREISSLAQPHLKYVFPLQSKEGTQNQTINKPDTGLLASMLEHDIMPFHKKSKSDLMIIYDLSQVVYYRHSENNPELAKLAASLFLFFSDFGY